ncbi:MAG: 1-acyl-sn-glycerol-3-phosphate acyltransferase [Kiritimatiellia bacterium]|jgi:1-acyl-sn-glycerol-3-phosphate acyltransferase
MSSQHTTSVPSGLQVAKHLPRSTLVWGGGFVLMLGSSLAAILTHPFLTPAQQSIWTAKVFSRVIWLTGCDFSVSYDPAFDRTVPSVFCFNHTNFLDAHTACRTIPQPFVGLMLAWHFKIPGYGWMMRATHGIPVHPASAGRTDELTVQVRDRVDHGLSILAFPEGHRTMDGKVRKYKRGMFFMARSAGIPVIPVAVRGMYAVNRKGSKLFIPGPVSVYVGPQIDPSTLDDDGITQLADAMHSAVSAYVEGRDRSGAGIAALAEWSPTASV